MQEIVQKWQFLSLKPKAESLRPLFHISEHGQFTLTQVSLPPTTNRQPSTVNRRWSPGIPFRLPWHPAGHLHTVYSVCL